jgi:hypothetical protein
MEITSYRAAREDRAKLEAPAIRMGEGSQGGSAARLAIDSLPAFLPWAMIAAGAPGRLVGRL